MRSFDFYDPRYRERYQSRDRRVTLRSICNEGDQFGRVQLDFIGDCRSANICGFRLQAVSQLAEVWTAEHPASPREALLRLNEALMRDGWTLDLIGLDPKWRETPKLTNSCFGIHPDIDGVIHMLDPKPVS